MSITQDELKELLHYDPETGMFTWKSHRGGTAYKYSVAGRKNTQGYIAIRVKGCRYQAHRLVWLYVNGYLPKYQIDHINGDGSDNRLCNLREATHAENQQNVSIRSDNTSGFPGVSWHKQAKKWRATIRIKRQKISLGLFSDAALAYEAYLKAKEQYHTFNPSVR